MLYEPGALGSGAWALQEQVLSTRTVHWGLGILDWECLSRHGSEADPEGPAHAYNSSCTDFARARRHKRVVLGWLREFDVDESVRDEADRVDTSGVEQIPGTE